MPLPIGAWWDGGEEQERQRWQVLCRAVVLILWVTTPFTRVAEEHQKAQIFTL